MLKQANINITPSSKRKISCAIFMNERYVIYMRWQMNVVVSIFHHELFDAMLLNLESDIRGGSRMMANEKNSFNRQRAKSHIKKVQLPIIDCRYSSHKFQYSIWSVFQWKLWSHWRNIEGEWGRKNYYSKFI